MLRTPLLLLPLLLIPGPPQKKPTTKPPAVLEPTELQKVLASAGTPPAVTSTSLTGAMVEAVASGKGRIDYQNGVARAIGLGALPPPTLSRSRAQDTLTARDAALADALRTLSMAIQQVRVTAESRVSNYILKSDEVRLRLEGVIKNAEVVEEKLLPDAGIYRVIVQVPLTGAGSVAEAVLPTGSEATAVPSGPNSPGMPAPADAEFTGLIVDCRGLRVAPSPTPKLFASDGEEVFGTLTVSPDFVLEHGIVAYPRTLDDAQRSPRIGPRPLIVRARAVHDSIRTEPILSTSDARRVRAANRTGTFLERCAVVFVVDR